MSRALRRRKPLVCLVYPHWWRHHLLRRQHGDTGI